MSDIPGGAPPLASIVVPFFNLAHNVDACIGSLLAQQSDGFTFEVIAVDNRSTDETWARLKNYEPRIRVLQQATPGAAAVRNCGIRAAHGRYVALIDGDCVASGRWLMALVGRIRDLAENAIIGGPILPKDADTLVSIFARQIFNQRQAMSDLRFPYAASGNMLLCRSLLMDVGLFDETFLRSHDVDFSWRAVRTRAARFVFVPEAKVFHDNPRTLGELFREGIKHGRGQALLSTRHAEITGRSLWQRMADPKRYREIISHFLGFAADWRGHGKRSAVSRAFQLYWCVFKSGKQLGCVSQGVRLLLSRQSMATGKRADRS